MSEQTSPYTVPVEAIRRSLDGCLRAAAFRRSPKLAAFLTYVVEEELAGRGDAIKAYTIATQALGRADSFDPSNDPSVRVEAGRLRRGLDEVYADEGRCLPVRIQVPVGAYRPSFQLQAVEDDPPPQGVPPAPAPMPAARLLQTAGIPLMPLFETRGQAVLALLLAVIAFLLAVEIALQIYMLAHGPTG
ncbi:hypothetical protein VQ02_16855 [Methylobacterium variabile]|jgi:hypothetical protein|uniref:Tetratricopeptide TPR_2 repeat protein n=1 Tax=Methylobacterium variabile TaxID=298794 RepID=A0A0J6SK84_9HYPH|nr:hypothetical protein [Methylobacterium variabile]KMO35680.1 hypothetical protein VQ02_16855 [Methylobacterium variabile]